jgi:prevent-host-death family protein
LDLVVEWYDMIMTLDVNDASNQLMSLDDQVAAGEEIVITKDGHPVARLVPMERTSTDRRKPSGLLGVTYVADDFDDPPPPDLLRQFGYDP